MGALWQRPQVDFTIYILLTMLFAELDTQSKRLKNLSASAAAPLTYSAAVATTAHLSVKRLSQVAVYNRLH